MPSPLKVGANTSRVARHRELREGLARRARQRVEHVALARVVERRCRRTRRTRAPVSSTPASVTIWTSRCRSVSTRQRRAGAVEDLQRAPLLGEIASSASRCAVRSRRILTKPTMRAVVVADRASSRRPPRTGCRPCARASLPRRRPGRARCASSISWRKTACSVALGEDAVQGLAEHLRLGPAEDAAAPAFQLVTRPSPSVLMIAVSIALSTIWRHWAAVI